jgi:hypothetical protein
MNAVNHPQNKKIKAEKPYKQKTPVSAGVFLFIGIDSDQYLSFLFL